MVKRAHVVVLLVVLAVAGLCAAVAARRPSVASVRTDIAAALPVGSNPAAVDGYIRSRHLETAAFDYSMGDARQGTVRLAHTEARPLAPPIYVVFRLARQPATGGLRLVGYQVSSRLIPVAAP